MSHIYSFEDAVPVIHPTAFVHETATVIGQVRVGADVYVGPGAVLRGDWGSIEIESGCNVQENCVIHMFPGVQVRLSQGAHVGHSAVIHGCQIGKNVMIGMNAVVMDDVEIGDESIVGALSFLPAEMKIPARSVVAGNPATVIKEVSDEMLHWKSEGTALYQRLPADCHRALKRCEPLTESKVEEEAGVKRSYLTWPEYQRKHRLKK
jgi:carbonic anhydrase/acetyltransferase-like protein (isoleucine patch superfamily)